MNDKQRLFLSTFLITSSLILHLVYLDWRFVSITDIRLVGNALLEGICLPLFLFGTGVYLILGNSTYTPRLFLWVSRQKGNLIKAVSILTCSIILWIVVDAFEERAIETSLKESREVMKLMQIAHNMSFTDAASHYNRVMERAQEELKIGEDEARTLIKKNLIEMIQEGTTNHEQ